MRLLILTLLCSFTVSAETNSACAPEPPFTGTLAALSAYRETKSKCPLTDYRKFLPAIHPDLYLDGKKLANQIWLDAKAPFAGKIIVSKNFDLSTALSNGDNFEYPHSEQEKKELDQWILSQPDFSISPHALFEQALAITHNQPEQAILLSWNLLSDKNHSSILERNLRARTLKLMDITGELGMYNHHDGGGLQSLKLHDFRGDNFSAWYHFFGTAIYGYAKERTNTPRLPLNFMIWSEYHLFSWSAIHTEKRLDIDRAGGAFGKQLAEYVNHPPAFNSALPAPAPDSNYLQDEPVRYENYIGHLQNTPLRPMSVMERALLGRALSLNPSLVTPEENSCIWKTLLSDNNDKVREYIHYLRGDKKAYQLAQSLAF